MTNRITGVLYEAKELSEQLRHGEIFIQMDDAENPRNTEIDGENDRHVTSDSGNLNPEQKVETIPYLPLPRMLLERDSDDQKSLERVQTIEPDHLFNAPNEVDVAVTQKPYEVQKENTLIFEEEKKPQSTFQFIPKEAIFNIKTHTHHYFDELKRLRQNDKKADDGTTWKEVLERRNNGLPMMDLEKTKNDLRETYQQFKRGTPPRVKSILMGTGIGFLSLGILLFLMIFTPVIWNEIAFGLKERGVIANTSQKVLENSEKTIEAQLIAESLGVKSEFSIVIPKIDAKANVIQDVDPLNKIEYLEALKEGVAHARGTHFPGEGKSIFLFSHSTDSPTNYTRYNAVFYLLKKLDPGDEIIVFLDGEKHLYTVDRKQVVEANDTSWLNPKGSRERLILMTCDPPGTTWKRLIVTALPAR